MNESDKPTYEELVGIITLAEGTLRDISDRWKQIPQYASSDLSNARYQINRILGRIHEARRKGEL